MQVCGALIARFGSKRVTVVAVAFAVLAINLPAWTSSPVALGVALFVFGLGNGAADVAMNDQAVAVERELATFLTVNAQVSAAALDTFRKLTDTATAALEDVARAAAWGR